MNLVNSDSVVVTLQAPAKLNLFLHVIGRQVGGKHDGYHLLQSIFALLDFGDTITLETRADTRVSRTSTLAGVPPEKDLVVRAATLLQTYAGRNMGCNISVEKRIPMGGGLGGGSSDAATVLLGLNRLWNLNLSNAALQRLGLSLGADVPFFINGQNAFSEGIGEVLTPVAVPNWWYLVLTPPETVPTPVIFSSPELTRDSISLKIADFSAVVDKFVLATLLRQCRNDLQPVVLKAFPVVAAHLLALQVVSAKSVFGARLTGSGACVFAAFEFERDARDAFQHLMPEYQGFVAQGMNCRV